jgi:amicyanin
MRAFVRHHHRCWTVVPVVAAGLLLAACGSDATPSTAPAATPGVVSGSDAPGFVPSGPMPGSMSGEMPGMPGMSGSAGPAGPPAAPVAGATAVAIQGFAYSPAAITVKVGTTVTWTNKDSEPHTVTTSNGPLHSPTMQSGATFSYTFTAPGTFSYLCTIHPFMTATVSVTA